jgi:CDP-paratose 2-epimerase
MSLRQISEWCRRRLGDHEVSATISPRSFDVPWLVLDAGLAARVWNWAPQRSADEILTGILDHASRHPGWLELSASG